MKYGLTLRELAAVSIHSRDTIANRMRESGMVARKPRRSKQVFEVETKSEYKDGIIVRYNIPLTVHFTSEPGHTSHW